MRVADIMTRNPVSVAPDASLNQMMELMSGRGIRHLPVMGAGRLVGIVSQRDLLSATGWIPLQPGVPLTARDVMHDEVATVSPDDSVVSMILELELRSVGCMPVVHDGQLIGIVSETDVLEAAMQFLDDDPPVREVMSRALEGVSPDVSIADAESLAKRAGVRHLLVSVEGQLVGILSDRDFRRSQGLGLDPEQPVQGIMSAELSVVAQDTPVSEAAARLVEHRIGALPVVEGGRAIGILSVADMLAHCENHLR